jgi:cytochrome b involved in lipid metabolism
MGLEFWFAGLPIRLQWALKDHNPSHTKATQAVLLRQQAKPRQIQGQIPATDTYPSSFSASRGRFTHSVNQYSFGVRRFDQGVVLWLESEEGEMPTLTKLYSMKEAALHNTPDDCWIVVDGKVAPLAL